MVNYIAPEFFARLISFIRHAFGDRLQLFRRGLLISSRFKIDGMIFKRSGLKSELFQYVKNVLGKFKIIGVAGPLLDAINSP
jgi:hypothetical protein